MMWQRAKACLSFIARALGLVTYIPRWAWDHAKDWLGIGAPRAHDARYMSQHALALACDHHGGSNYVFWGIEGRPWLLDMATYADIREGDVVWVRIEDLARFNSEVLAHGSTRFVLVTAESDYSVPSDFAAAADDIVKSGRVLRWFATNFDGSAHASLITCIPLGMNYRKKHDLHRVQTPQGNALLRRERLSVRAQEQVWERVAASALPPEERQPLAYADFWLNNSSQARRYGESREDIALQLEGNDNVVFPSHIVDSETLLSAYARHAFVISPHGRGLDCYRTWEALFVGCIVIVKHSPLDALYRHLPVVIVNDWNEITRENLALWLTRFGSSFDRAHLRRYLSLEHWRQQLHAHKASVSQNSEA